jgi:hypothetical protein
MGLKFNDIDLKANYNFVVTEVQGRGSAPVSRTVLDHPLVHGDIELNAKLRSRDVIIRGYVYGSDAAAKKDFLIKLITQAYEKECKLTFPDTNRSIYVKLAGEPIVIGPIGPSLNAQAYEITFQFVAQDPFFYDEQDTTAAGFRIVRVDAYAPNYLISPRRAILKREKQVMIEPYTIVNLAGKYGNFEVDSNGDGLADGWEKTNYVSAQLVGGVCGSKAQLVSAVAFTNNTGSTAFLQAHINTPVADEHYYFAAVWVKKSTDSPGNPRVYFDIVGGSTPQFVVMLKYVSETVWARHYGSFKVQNGNTTASFKLHLATVPIGESFSETRKLYADGYILVPLTMMGKLPRSLQEFFRVSGVTTWQDLATTSNITGADGRTQSGNAWLAELIPYVDSVASFGFVWQ